DLDLFDADLLDSLGFAELLVTIEEEFGIVISPSEVERTDMNTVNKIITMIASRS
ncbi:MAG: phosphopantetheine-binding protein, partial [Acetivibrio sp.]